MNSYRNLDPQMGVAVAARTVLRTTPEQRETWGDVATRVAVGNLLLHPEVHSEYIRLRDHIAQGRILMSGRHLQHGDAHQPTRNIEVHTNCATAATSFMLFYLLLNGSGVGRSYDDDLLLVDWNNMPVVVPVLERTHSDFEECGALSPEEAFERYPGALWFVVEDSREGWAKALEFVEVLTFRGHFRNNTVILDFSRVRPKGAPIKGMQNRPSSGPGPVMKAFVLASELTRQGTPLPNWHLTMHIDHYFADAVVVGGARRSARMAVKNYKDPGIFEFINIKEQGGLWTANNSVGVDATFWAKAQQPDTRESAILKSILFAQYNHATGEPGIINLDKLHSNMEGFERHLSGDTIGNEKYPIDTDDTKALYGKLAERVSTMQYPYIVNPCGEIPLNVLGGYCVIADVVPFYALKLSEALDAFRIAARALVRVNKMSSLYHGEVERTNRIGVGFTGIHEFMWKHFGITFRQALDEHGAGKKFWEFMDLARRTVEASATDYAKQLGVAVPHTFTTVKPAGTTSKLFSLTEGAHLPTMKWYLRWVQFQDTDPLVEEYRAKGYPVQDSIPGGSTGRGYTKVKLVGFPTEPLICTLGIPDDELVTASEATIEEQYEWVRLIEKYWLGPNGNQVSYTLKYTKEAVSFEEYCSYLAKHQPTVRCLSVMPSDDWKETEKKYGYVPEQPIDRTYYEELLVKVEQKEQTINLEDLQCASGACPI